MKYRYIINMNLVTVVSKWDKSHGYNNQEKEKIPYLCTKYMYHFWITIDEFFDKPYNNFFFKT